MIFAQLKEQLSLLKQSLSELTKDHYAAPVKHLSGSSIGGHCRHIIELLQCATKGYEIGVVDYVHRQRNLLLEQDIVAAITMINLLEKTIIQVDRQLTLVCDGGMSVPTSYYREIVYNTEHAIHHLAIIKVALIELNISEIVGEHFGLAYSTIQYRQDMAGSKSNG